jgi:uncharacterized membrane protein YhaH (DUF805 family)
MPSLRYVLRLWFGVSLPVGRVEYAVSGLLLMLVKYGIEALVIWRYTSTFFAPWDFVNPLLSVRTAILQPAPEFVPWALFVWTLPFLWIAISMSVRRMADAGGSPWMGMLVLVPVFNLLFMLAMCLPPSRHNRWSPSGRGASDRDLAKSAVLAVAASLNVGAVMLVVSVYLFSTYGASLFLGTPMLMGATAAYLFNRHYARGYAASIMLGLAAVFFAGMALLLLALEGLICVAMAAPLMLPIGAMGGLLGKAIADSTRRAAHELMAAIVVLPLLAGVESLVAPKAEYVVTTVVEIDAPPEVVWNNVIGFPELPPATAWYFRYGIACPQRARIVGQGVGAIRYCEFTTGTFVEPITVWEPPQRLAFDVTEQPAPMFELSPYRHVHPPHLDGFLRSNRGEFRLLPLSGGRTRLEGSTWYEFDMFPHAYWTLWSDLLIHRIHHRVLKHIKRLSEQPPASR